MSDKYKMFRNFMVNDLGITRDDIMLWTKEAVAETVTKLAGQISIPAMVKQSVDSKAWEFNSNVKKIVAEELAARIVISIKECKP